MERNAGGKRAKRGVAHGGRGTREGAPSSAGDNTHASGSSVAGPSGLSSLGQGPVNLSNEHRRQSVLQWLMQPASSSLTSSSSQSRPQMSSSASSASVQHEAAQMSTRVPTTVDNPFSEDLFDDKMRLGSEGMLKDQEAKEDDFLCSDAQLLMPSEEVKEAGQSAKIPGGRQRLAVPLACSPQLLDAESQDDQVTCVDDDDDDDIADPSWSFPQNLLASASSVDEEEDDGVVSIRVPPQKGRGRSQKSADMIPPATVSANPAPRLSPSKRSRTSQAWAFFEQASDSPSDVICRLCRKRISRGKNLKWLTTTNMSSHMQRMHELKWREHLAKKGQTDAGPPTTVTPSVSASSSSATTKRSSAAHVSQSHDQGSASASASTVARVPPAPPETHPTPSPSASLTTCTPYSGQSSSQPSVFQVWEQKKHFNPNHPKAKSLNVGIARLLALEMLPFRLVDTDGFRHVMALACPQYQMPSRHFFARKAVPALASHVSSKISSALSASVSGKVHLTTDTWTSKHGQGRYISVTAHWVSWVDVSGGDGGSQARRTLFKTAGMVQGSFPQGPLVASRAQRHQAVLKLICLGDRPHTGQELWTALSNETERWLGDKNLVPGKVVCDNGRNLLAALKIGRLEHIPCLAHVMNLVVQKFLKSYPGLDCLLKKARGLSSHFRRSHPASSRLAALQRQLGLPVNRLIVDVATRWNSTLHMLQRLWQQRNAITQYEVTHGLTSSGADLGVLSHREWRQVKELCTILASFEEATKMVSADNALVSMSIVVILVLERSLDTLKQQVPPATEEETDTDADTEPFSPSNPQGPTVSQFHRSSLGSGSGSRASARWRISSQGASSQASQGCVEAVPEAAEEEEEEVFLDTDVTDVPALERGWREFEAEEEDEEDQFASAPRPRGLGNQGSISHMSAWMLHFLQHDPRIKAIKMNNSYWVATLLDPRYKTKLSTFLPPTQIESKMQEMETLLIDQLETSVASASRSPNVTVEQHQRRDSSRVPSRRSGSSRQGGRSLMGDLWQSLFTTSPTHAMQGTHPTHRDQLKIMVHDYLRLNTDVFVCVPDPIDFWVSKMDEWPELARHAIEVLSCPAASVISERTFSTAGGVITDKRIRLSTDNVDRLTFIKMNQAWISDDVVAPIAEVTD